jgi:hypothetical protein
VDRESSPKGGFPGPLSPDTPTGRFRRMVVKKAKVEGFDTLFIKYANYPLMESAEPLNNFIEEFEKYLFIPKDMWSALKVLVAILIKIAEMDNADEACNYMKQIISERKSVYGKLVLESIFKYVYGYPPDLSTVVTLSHHCEKSCGVRIERKRALGRARFSSQNQPKCFQCDHLYFKYILTKIFQNKEYSQIIGFKHFINQSEIVFKTSAEIINDPAGSPYKQRLIRAPIWHGPIRMNLDFGAFIRALISQNLREFLINDNRMKIKLCGHCGIFFVASKVDQRIKYCQNCSPKSKMSKEVRNKYQKKRYWKLKGEKLAKEHEAKISNYMDKLGCTRKEAENIIKADSNL